MSETVYVRATRAQVRARLSLLPAILAGRVPDPTGMAEGILLRLGVQALSLIREAFLVKAAGGTDEAGISWPPLKPATIAYSRRHPGLNRKRAAARAKGRETRPLLTNPQDRRWRELFSSKLRQLSRKTKGAVSDEMKGQAAAYAWMIVKSEGGKTILGEYGQTKVEILRDTGLLLNSLSPGLEGPSGHANQIFQLELGAVIVGTNRKGAGAHHRGDPARNLPQRQLWPEPSAWPDRWNALLARRASEGLERMATALATAS